VVPWATPGISNNIVLVGWSSNLGTTWAAARTALSDWSTTQIPNAFLGISHTGFITPLASSVSPGTVVFGNANIAQGMPIGNSLLTQLYILPVPEPSTMALAGLGALSLMLFRRKNK
jgi:hypothetical protein